MLLRDLYVHQSKLSYSIQNPCQANTAYRLIPRAFISLGLLVSASLGTCPRIRN